MRTLLGKLTSKDIVGKMEYNQSMRWCSTFSPNSPFLYNELLKVKMMEKRVNQKGKNVFFFFYIYVLISLKVIRKFTIKFLKY